MRGGAATGSLGWGNGVTGSRGAERSPGFKSVGGGNAVVGTTDLLGSRFSLNGARRSLVTGVLAEGAGCTERTGSDDGPRSTDGSPDSLDRKYQRPAPTRMHAARIQGQCRLTGRLGARAGREGASETVRTWHKLSLYLRRFSGSVRVARTSLSRIIWRSAADFSLASEWLSGCNRRANARYAW